MEEKERNDRPQEIPQHTQPTEAHFSTSSRPLDIVSRSVGPFCLRRRVEAQTAQGIYRFTSIYYIKHSMKLSELRHYILNTLSYLSDRSEPQAGSIKSPTAGVTGASKPTIHFALQSPTHSAAQNGTNDLSVERTETNGNESKSRPRAR